MFRHEGFEYLFGIEDAFDDPRIREVTVKKSGQTALTTAALNYIGKTIHQDPGGWLIVYPTLASVKRFSKRKLGPMIRDCEVLKDRVKDSSNKSDIGDTFEKTYPGGFISMVSGKSLSSVSAQSIQRALTDELNRFAQEVGSEGDLLTIIKKRFQGFLETYKWIKISTPTEKNLSLITQEFEKSDQRFYFVPCPVCGYSQTLRFENLHWEKSIRLSDGADLPKRGERDTIYVMHGSKKAHKWNGKDYDKINIDHLLELESKNPVISNGKLHHPSTAYYECEKCHGHLNDKNHRLNMIKNGNWIKQNPQVMDHAGFFLNELYSPLSTYEYVVSQFLDAKDNVIKLKSFTNLVLGEDWEDKTRREIDSNSLILRCETYGPKLPEGVIVLTAGVDTQDDRLEVKVKGWGIGDESWLIDYDVIPGNPGEDRVWQQLDLYLQRTYEHHYGAILQIGATCVDMLGHHTQQVLKYCNARSSRNIYAIFGKGDTDTPIPVFTVKASKTEDGKFDSYRIGVDAAKELVYSRLSILDYGPGYMHFPKELRINKDTQRGTPLEISYFEGLTAEKQVETFERGKQKRRWKKIRTRNEPLDLENYAYAARLSLRFNDEDLLKIQDSIKNFQHELFSEASGEIVIAKSNSVKRNYR